MSSAAVESRPRPRWVGELGALLAAILACAGISSLQPRLAASIVKIRLKDDAAALPPPAQLKAMTLGYKSAAADLLWAKLLVEHGFRFQERRTFPSATRYVDGIIELQPDHSMIYTYVDTLLVLAKPGGKAATEEDAKQSRVYLQRGTKERPYDHDVWLHYGQYLAFLAPQYLTNPEEIDRWRTEGAYAMGRAVELGADADRSLTVGTLLSRAGEKQAAIQQLQRAFAITDNPDTRVQITLKLQRLQATPDAEDRVGRVESEWRARYPFLSRGTTLLIGPHRSPSWCAGPMNSNTTKCPNDWPSATAR